VCVKRVVLVLLVNSKSARTTAAAVESATNLAAGVTVIEALLETHANVLPRATSRLQIGGRSLMAQDGGCVPKAV